ncbi:hypothetical protein AB0368_08500 [Actinoplanes sp. NPDC051475]|uniref:hypothetical protein n=1 Tax=Actinoplanes sp. NPDC051475 TaxID=3157225 RepID=UPI00344E76D8
MRTNPLRRRLFRLAVTAAAVPATLLPLAATPASAAAAPTFTKIEGAAADAAGLQPTVDAYRSLLGDPNNGSTPGSQPAGRREINWDGTPDAQSAPNALPRDFFNTTVPRGAVFSSGAGNRFQVSADTDNPTHTPVRFGNLNTQYPTVFGTFSPQRLFTPVGTNQMSIKFFSPGTNTPATVNGFGAVFTDVDKADTTKIELYDRWGTRLWWHAVPKGTTASKSLSFLGVKTGADVYEVRITTGNAPLSSTNTDTSTRDVVVMDDLLYGEPKAL